MAESASIRSRRIRDFRLAQLRQPRICLARVCVCDPIEVDTLTGNFRIASTRIGIEADVSHGRRQFAVSIQDQTRDFVGCVDPESELRILLHGDQHILAARGLLLRCGLLQILGSPCEEPRIPIVKAVEVRVVHVGQRKGEEPCQVTVLTDRLQHGQSHCSFGKTGVSSPQRRNCTADLGIAQLRVELRMIGGKHASSALSRFGAEPGIVYPSAQGFGLGRQLLPC